MTPLLKQHGPLVRRLAHQMRAKLPASVEVDDLIQVGMIGLADALSRFDAEQGVPFEAFAAQRVRGAMLDGLRDSDHLSRSERKHQRDAHAAATRLEQRLGRVPHDSEIAQELGLTLEEYQGKGCGTQLVYLEDLADDGNALLDWGVADSAPTPLEQLQDRRRRVALVEAIKGLPERWQQVMLMYYEHDMTQKEIAAVLKVAESRVCQMRGQSIERLRTELGGRF